MLTSKLALAAIVLVGSLAVTATDANAESVEAYVCEVAFLPREGIYGQFGAVVLRARKGPNCTGELIPFVWFCSTGATSETCDTDYLYRELALNTLAQNLTTAQASGLKIRVYYKPPVTPGPTVRGSSVTFLAN